MKDQKKILNQFQESIGEISKTFVGFSKQIEEIAKQAESNLTEEQSAVIDEFKKDSQTLKSGDFASLIKLRDLYEQKIKDGI
tara:strand:+ start:2283 stop:2528 length:246 start_codon:yes stop_codon:yes gene_type:complete